MHTRTLAFLAGLLISGVAFAQAPSFPATLTLAWTLPTQAVDGTSLTGAQGLTSIEVWVDTQPIPDAPTAQPTATLGAAVVTATETITAKAGDTLHARIAACNAFGCSALTNDVTQLVSGAVPGVPTNVTIKINLTPGQ